MDVHHIWKLFGKYMSINLKIFTQREQIVLGILRTELEMYRFMRGFLFVFFSWFLFCFVCFCFSIHGFSVALGPVLELALVDQTCFELTQICLPLCLGCWD